MKGWEFRFFASLWTVMYLPPYRTSPYREEHDLRYGELIRHFGSTPHFA